MEPSRKTILFIFGTRPEAIKMAPLIRRFEAKSERFNPVVAVTAQHRHMLDQVLDLFRIRVDYDLDIMEPAQKLVELTSRALVQLTQLVEEVRPDLVLVQGDTTTTFAGALASFYRRIPVGHVEAGLRTYDRHQPYPEEVNRVMTTALADLHFVPTEQSERNLRREGVPADRVHVTGNTVIDALLDVSRRDYRFAPELDAIFSKPGVRHILLTTHRRESYGPPMERTCRAVLTLLERFPDVEVVFPVHLNPQVRGTVFGPLGSHPRIHLIEPLDYQAFVNAMKNVYVILTDSGGVQEEAPTLGKPVLLLRQTTERPEAIAAGAVKLVGTDEAQIVDETSTLLSDPAIYQEMASSVNPYGDGRASQRICDIVDRFLHSRN